MNFTKYYIEGKDYIFCPDKTVFESLSENSISGICNRLKGVGADGFLTFNNNYPKTSIIKGFAQNGKCMQNFSSASICAFFELFSATGISTYTFQSENGQFFYINTERNENNSVFCCTVRSCAGNGIFNTLKRKTEIGNRILTITPVMLQSIYTVHFTDCKKMLNIGYLGEHISKNSLFGKEASLILAESTGKNSFDIGFYENDTGCPRPEISAFGATALAACRNGICNYGELISVNSEDNTVYVTCNSPEIITIRCTCKKVFEGKYKLSF